MVAGWLVAWAGSATLALAQPQPQSQPQPGAPADIARIVARGTLVVAMRAEDTPPFFYQRDGQLQGVEVEMARALARELGVALRVDRSPTSFNAVVDAVARGQADLGLSKLSRTLAEAKDRICARHTEQLAGVFAGSRPRSRRTTAVSASR